MLEREQRHLDDSIDIIAPPVVKTQVAAVAAVGIVGRRIRKGVSFTTTTIRARRRCKLLGKWANDTGLGVRVEIVVHMDACTRMTTIREECV